jgi:hypothetical protein
MTSRSNTFYEHVQRSRVTGIAAVAGAAVLGVAVFASESDRSGSVVPTVIAMLALVAVINAFARLKVEVGPGELVIGFTYGWPRRTIQRSEIQSFEIVRNSPIWGWGIRWIPGGWLWNVWGLDAVELRLAGGRRLRIGTDDPDGLLAALST